jgi:hypothetical protein
VLKCLKKIVSILKKEVMSDLIPTVLKGITSFSGRQRLMPYVKYILRRLIKKTGKEEVKKQTPEEHHALVEYVDKMIRREVKHHQKARY